MQYWAVLLGVCAVLTIVGTLAVKRPMPVAIGVSVLTGIVTGLYGARNSPLWIVGTIIVIVCSMPVTIVTGIVTENLMDKWRSGSGG